MRNWQPRARNDKRQNTPVGMLVDNIKLIHLLKQLKVDNSETIARFEADVDNYCDIHRIWF